MLQWSSKREAAVLTNRTGDTSGQLCLYGCQLVTTKRQRLKKVSGRRSDQLKPDQETSEKEETESEQGALMMASLPGLLMLRNFL